MRARLSALRTRTEAASSDAVILATLRVALPRNQWFGAFSYAHPEVRIEVLGLTELDPAVSVSDCWIGGRPAGLWASELSRLPGAIRVESLAEVGQGCLYRITFQNPPIVYFFRRLGAPMQFPIWLQAGVGSLEVVSRYPEFRKILEFARSISPEARVVSMHRGPLRSHLPSLTDAQQRILSAALTAGYFEVPRRVSLTELAHRLRRSRSALSETMASIEEKLLESALTSSALRVAASAEPSRTN